MQVGKALVADIEALETEVKGAFKRLEPAVKDVEFQRLELEAMEEVLRSQRDKVARAEMNLEALSGQAREHIKKVRFYETLVVSGLDVLGLSDPEGLCERLDALAAMCGESKKPADQAQKSPTIVVVPMPVPVPEPEPEPEPEPVPVFTREAPKAQEPLGKETAQQWVVRLANMVSQTNTFEAGHSPLQLLAAWAVKELTMSGRSNNYHVVGTYSMSEAIVKALDQSPDKVLSRRDLDISVWRERMKSAATRAVAAGLPIRQIDYTKANVPKHIGKTGSTKGFEWAGSKPTASLIP